MIYGYIICKITPVIVGLQDPQTSLNFYETVPYTNFLTLRNRTKEIKYFVGSSPKYE